MAAYLRRSDPQIPMMKYIGTSTASKNTKKKNRSSERNTPSIPASRISVKTANSLRRSSMEVEAASEIGTSSDVSRTSGMEIPSMPRYQTARSMYCDSVACSKTASRQPESHGGSTDRAVASGRKTSLRRLGTKRTATDARAGRSTSQVSMAGTSDFRLPTSDSQAPRD